MNKINHKNIMSVAERLKLIAEENGLSLRKLSVSIGKTPGYLSASINKGTEVGSDALSQILVNYPEYNIKWVLTGEGEKLQKDASNNILVNEKGVVYNLDSDIQVEPHQQLINIEVLLKVLKKELGSELLKISTNQDNISKLASNQGTILMKIEELTEKMELKKSS